MVRSFKHNKIYNTQCQDLTHRLIGLGRGAVVIQVGDASAGQSPLSFGGFGNMVRHLPRLSMGLDGALRANRLSRRDLSLLQAWLCSMFRK